MNNWMRDMLAIVTFGALLGFFIAEYFRMPAKPPAAELSKTVTLPETVTHFALGGNVAYDILRPPTMIDMTQCESLEIIGGIGTLSLAGMDFHGTVRQDGTYMLFVSRPMYGQCTSAGDKSTIDKFKVEKEEKKDGR